MFGRHPIRFVLGIIALIIMAVWVPHAIFLTQQAHRQSPELESRVECSYANTVKSIRGPPGVSVGQNCLSITKVPEAEEKDSEAPEIHTDVFDGGWGQLLTWLTYKTFTDPLALFTLGLLIGTAILAWYTFALFRDARENSVTENRAWIKVIPPQNGTLGYASEQSEIGHVSIPLQCRNIGKGLATKVGFELGTVDFENGQSYHSVFQEILSRPHSNFRDVLFPRNQRPLEMRGIPFPRSVIPGTPSSIIGLVVVAFYRVSGSSKWHYTPVFRQIGVVDRTAEEEVGWPTHLGPVFRVVLVPADQRQIQDADETPK